MPQAVSTATPAAMREVNRSIILNLIRTEQPVSRAGLAERTGIAPSNVSAIVDELVEAGFVGETKALPAGRGRIPVHLRLREDGPVFAGASVREDVTTLAVAGLSGRILEREEMATPAAPVEFVEELAARLRRFGGVREIGVSVPGTVDPAAGCVLLAPGLPLFSNYALTAEMERTTGIPTVIQNDCQLAALAATWLREPGTAGIDDFVFIEVGDVGLGGGIIFNRQLYSGHDGSCAAVFGHMVIEAGGGPCRCGGRGCWELYVCNRATWGRYAPRKPFDRARLPDLLRETQAGNPRALAAWQRTAEYLAVGISNIVLALNPRAILVAGRITEVWEQVRGSLKDPRIRPLHIRAEELFLQGAVSLAAQRLFASPRFGL